MFYAKSKIARKYKISLTTLRKYLLLISGIDANKRKYSKAEYNLIINHLGNT